jgi:hypothetical protein
MRLSWLERDRNIAEDVVFRPIPERKLADGDDRRTALSDVGAKSSQLQAKLRRRR